MIRLLAGLALLLASGISCAAEVVGLGSLEVLSEIADGASIQCPGCGIHYETLLRELRLNGMPCKANGQKLMAEIRYVSREKNKAIEGIEDDFIDEAVIPIDGMTAQALLHSKNVSDIRGFPATAVILDIQSPVHHGHVTRYIATASDSREAVSSLIFATINALINIAKDIKGARLP